MKRRFIAVGTAALLSAAGCQNGAPRKVIDHLPSPIVGGGQDRSLRPPVPAAPRPTPPPAPVRARPAEPTYAESSWAPPHGFSPRWKYIIVHHSADDRSTPQGMTDWHVNGKHWDELGYHFVIGNGVNYPDGKVYVGTRWPKQKHGAHTRVKAGDDNHWNLQGIGICLIGNFEHHGPTARQMESLTRLVTYLAQQCNIPPNRIYGHHDADPYTRCPGQNFSLAALRRRVIAAEHGEPVHAFSN